MKRLKSILIVALIFACGLIVGGVLGGLIGWHGLFHKVTRGGPNEVRRVLLDRAKDDLRLNDDQYHAVWMIANETGASLDQALEPVRPELDRVFSDSESRIRAVLRPDQLQKFDWWVKETRKHWSGEIAPKPETAQNPEPVAPGPSAPAQVPTSPTFGIGAPESAR